MRSLAVEFALKSEKKIIMDKFSHIPIIGSVPSLVTTSIDTPDNAPELLVKSHVIYRRFAIEITDDDLDTFGLQMGAYAIFREQRYPTYECTVCLVTFGDEATMRVLDGIIKKEFAVLDSPEPVGFDWGC